MVPVTSRSPSLMVPLGVGAVVSPSWRGERVAVTEVAAAEGVVVAVAGAGDVVAATASPQKRSSRALPRFSPVPW